MRAVMSRIAGMFQRRRLDSELNEELRAHLEMAAEENQRGGMPADEAWRAALRDFGGVTQVRETVRMREGMLWMENVRRDLAYALRVLQKSPGFAVVAIASLALGIGANTAIFSIAKSALMDRLDVPQAGELRLFAWNAKRKSVVHSSWGDFDRTQNGVTSTSFSYPIYQLMRKQNHQLEDLFAFKNLGRVNVTAEGEAEVVQADLVSGNFYEQMRVRPQLGRPIEPADDDKPGASPVAVISDGYWSARFNRSPSVIGKTILVNLVNVTIVGVNPPGFTGAKGTQSSAELFMPFSVQPQVFPYRNEASLLTSDKVWWMQIMGRAKPGMDERRAQAALDVALKSAVHATMTVKPEESIPDLMLEDGSRGMNEASRQFETAVVADDGAGGPGGAAGVREHGQPDAGAIQRAAEGDERAHGAGRGADAHPAPGVDGESAAGVAGRIRRPGGRLLRETRDPRNAFEPRRSGGDAVEAWTGECLGSTWPCRW